MPIEPTSRRIVSRTSTTKSVEASNENEQKSRRLSDESKLTEKEKLLKTQKTDSPMG